MKITLKELKDHFASEIIEVYGHDQDSFTEISPLAHAHKSSLVFLNSPKYINAWLDSPAGVALISPSIKKSLPESVDRPYVVTPLPELLMSHISHKYFAPSPFKEKRTEKIHSTAQIGAQTHIGKSTLIDPFAVIGEKVKVGEHCYIGPHVVIEDHVELGDHTWIGGQSYVGSYTQIGSHCRIQPQCLIGGEPQIQISSSLIENQQWATLLEDRVEIGAQNIIERGNSQPTRIQEGTKTDNHVVFKSEVQVGKNCLLTAGLLMLRGSKMGSFCITGGNTLVAADVTVGDQVQLAGLSFVEEDVLEKGFYGGHPLQPLKDYLKTLAILPHLPQIQKELGLLRSGKTK